VVRRDSDDPGGRTPVWPSAEEFREELARRLNGDLEEVIGRSIVAVRRRIPEYSGPAVTHLRMAVEVTAGLLLSTSAAGREATPDEMARVEDAGERLLLDGPSLDAVQDAVAVVTAMLYDEARVLADAIAPKPRVGKDTGLVDTALRHLTFQGQGLFSRLSAACIAVHERGEHGRVSEETAQFFDALLFGEFTDDADALAAAQEAGLTVSAPCAVVAIGSLEGGARHLRDRIARVRPVVAEGLVGQTMTEPCPHVVAIVPLQTRTWRDLTDALDRVASEAGVFAVVAAAPSLSEISRCYQGLRRRLEGGAIVGWAGCLTPFTLTLPWLASRMTPEERFLDTAEVLGPCLARRRDLARKDIETLRALRDARGERKEAARRLGISRNAVNRRIRGVAGRLGVRFDNPMDLVALGLAVALYWVDPDSLPPPGDPAWKAAVQVVRAPEESEADALHLVPSDAPGGVWPGRRRAGHLRVVEDDT